MTDVIEPFYVAEARISGCANICEIEPGLFLYTYFTRQYCPLTRGVENVVAAKLVFTMPALKQTACMTRSVFGFLALND